MLKRRKRKQRNPAKKRNPRKKAVKKEVQKQETVVEPKKLSKFHVLQKSKKKQKKLVNFLTSFGNAEIKNILIKVKC